MSDETKKVEGLTATQASERKNFCPATFYNQDLFARCPTCRQFFGHRFPQQICWNKVREVANAACVSGFNPALEAMEAFYVNASRTEEMMTNVMERVHREVQMLVTKAVSQAVGMNEAELDSIVTGKYNPGPLDEDEVKRTQLEYAARMFASYKANIELDEEKIGTIKASVSLDSGHVLAAREAIAKALERERYPLRTVDPGTAGQMTEEQHEDILGRKGGEPPEGIEDFLGRKGGE